MRKEERSRDCIFCCFFSAMPNAHVTKYLQKVSSTEALSHLHALFERDILSVGGKISSRWRLCHHDNKVTTHVQPIEDVNKKGAPLCEREEVDGGKEEGTREMDLSTEKVELSPSLSSSMLDQSPQKLTAVGSRESPPTAVSPHEQPESSSQETTEVVNPSYQPCSSLLSEMMEKPKLHDDLCSSVPSEVRWGYNGHWVNKEWSNFLGYSVLFFF